MPLYPVRCASCSHRCDLYASMSQRDGLKCPECGHARMETRFEDLGLRNANREFDLSRRESIQHFYPAGEVQEYRQLYGSAGNCIQDDGTVIFNNRAEEKAFRKAKQSHEARLRQQQAEHDAKHDPSLIPVDGVGERRGRRRASKLAEAT